MTILRWIRDYFPLLILAAAVIGVIAMITAAIVYTSRWEARCHAAGGWSPNIRGNLCVRDGLIIDVYGKSP